MYRRPAYPARNDQSPSNRVVAKIEFSVFNEGEIACTWLESLRMTSVLDNARVSQ